VNSGVPKNRFGCQPFRAHSAVSWTQRNWDVLVDDALQSALFTQDVFDGVVQRAKTFAQYVVYYRKKPALK
jgi:hypothetical protein